MPAKPIRGSAFTLLELVIAIAILSLIVLVSSQAIDSGMRMNDRIALQAELDGRADAALNALALELRSVDDRPANLKVGNSGYSSTPVSDVYTYRLAQGIRRVAMHVGGDGDASVAESSAGTASDEAFATDWEPGCHRLEYLKDDGSGLVYYAQDGSVVPPTGTLTRYTYSDPAGTVLTRTEVITDRIRQDGFSITRVGDTLRLALSLQAPYQNGAHSVLVRAADAKVLFLRSSMTAAPDSSADPSDDAASESHAAHAVGETSGPSPLISLGRRQDIIAGGRQQIAIHIAAPVGSTVKPAFTQVTVITHPSSAGEAARHPLAIGTPIDIAPGTLEHLVLTDATPLNPDGVTSSDGTYTVTITGTMIGPLTVEVAASTGSATVGARVATKDY